MDDTVEKFRAEGGKTLTINDVLDIVRELGMIVCADPDLEYHQGWVAALDQVEAAIIRRLNCE